MSLTLLIDDLRDIQADIICRTYQGAEQIINTIWLQDWTLFLDHDLGESKTGYDIINLMLNTSNIPGHIIIVSSNPVGRDNIGRALDSTGMYKRCSPHEFKRINDDKTDNDANVRDRAIRTNSKSHSVKPNPN